MVAYPHGFCAGVERAIGAVEAALERFGAPVYVRGEIVHSGHVVRGLERLGARFVASEEDVPAGAVCVLSAHGVAPAVRERAHARGLRVVDATCPLVAKVHVEVRRHAHAARYVVIIGRRGHEEVEGVAGEVPPERVFVVARAADVDALPIPRSAPVGYVTQTTLAIDDVLPLIAHLRARFTDVVGPGKADVCYASQNRQAAVQAIAPRCDVVLIAGARNSSNSNRLVEVARAAGTPAHLVPDAPALRTAWLDGVRVVGFGAGASAPPVLIDAILARLEELGYDAAPAGSEGVAETVRFPAPRLPA
jgi:4-hydroxy-3-methylbut-2-en-1-yl diphosphate reductase